jgi:hypothetical protein
VVPGAAAATDQKPPAAQPTPEEPPTAADSRALPSDATIVLPKTLDDWKQESRSQGR